MEVERRHPGLRGVDTGLQSCKPWSWRRLVMNCLWEMDRVRLARSLWISKPKSWVVGPRSRDWLLIWTDSVKCMQNLLTSINLLMPILPRLSAPFKRRLQFDPVLNLPRLAMSSIISRGYLTTAMLTEDVLLGNIWEIQEHMQYKQRGDDTSSQDIRDGGCWGKIGVTGPKQKVAGISGIRSSSLAQNYQGCMIV